MDDFLAKPVSRERLARVMQKWLATGNAAD
jgi:two-component SAPR family response regulator